MVITANLLLSIGIPLFIGTVLLQLAIIGLTRPNHKEFMASTLGENFLLVTNIWIILGVFITIIGTMWYIFW